MLLARAGQLGITLLELLYGLDDLQALRHHAALKATYLPQYIQEQLGKLQGAASDRTKLQADIDREFLDFSRGLQLLKEASRTAYCPKPTLNTLRGESFDLTPTLRGDSSVLPPRGVST